MCQFSAEEMKGWITGRQTLGSDNGGRSGADCKLSKAKPLLDLLSTPEMLGNWTEGCLSRSDVVLQTNVLGLEAPRGQNIA